MTATAVAPASAATNGAAEPRPSPPVASTYADLPVTALTPHPVNRSHFDPAKWAELKASIAKSGILTPLLVRPHGKGYQILAGERRWGVAKELTLDTVPCRIRDVPDDEAIEFLLIENLQRENVHPLDEAAGFVALMKHAKARYTPAAIGARIGQSTKYVYDRIKLLQLIPEAQKLFREGVFSAGHAIILARLSKDDQERALDRDGVTMYAARGANGGLWQEESPLFVQDPDDDADEDGPPVKPVTVREFQGWVDKHVRFDPTDEKELPNLFPETYQELSRAVEQELKVVHITHDHYVAPEARDDQVRTIGPRSWRRADGTSGAPRCDHAVLGVVVIGPERGAAFAVCLEKQKCAVHWKYEQRQAKRRAASSARETADQQAERWRERDTLLNPERERWQKARPALLKALATKIHAMPAGADGALAKLVIDRCAPYRVNVGGAMSRGKTAEDVVRYAAFLCVLHELSEVNAPHQGPAALKRFGIDAKRIVAGEAKAVQTSAKKGGGAKAKRPTKKRA